MNKEELSEWFWDKFNNCYPVKHIYYPNSIFWFYDEQFNRKIKLCKLNNQKLNFDVKFKDNCLFEQNIKDKYLFCNYDKIWIYFQIDNNDIYRQIQQNIIETLNENEKFKLYTPLVRNLIWKDMMRNNIYLTLITDI